MITPIKGKGDAIGSISLESRGRDRLALGYALAPEAWGKGLATEAAEAMIDAAFSLTSTVEILASVRVEDEASKAVVEKCGFVRSRRRPARRPGARRDGRVPQLPPWPRGLAGRRRRRGVRRPSAWRAPRDTLATMKFLDQARVYVRSGDGGAGSVSFRREKFIEFGGPDGGDGGRGGDVVVECADGLNTLIDFRYQQHFKAKTGMHGMGRNRAGGRGDDAVLKVPVGTQILDAEGGKMPRRSHRAWRAHGRR